MPGKKSKHIKAVIFDLDGTLIDSFHAIMEGFNSTLPRYGLSKLNISETKALVGLSLEETFSNLLGKEHAHMATSLFRKRYKDVYLEKTSPMPYADITIKTLNKGGYKIGVATNKHGGFSRSIIDHLGWGESMLTVVGDGDIPSCKPSPDMIEKNLKDMSVSKDEAIFVGDSPVDMETGKNAGVFTVAVPTGHHSGEILKEAGAMALISDLSGLGAILEQYGK
ncbi:MAG: HAD family hydrolase [bacterium]|nr:HAD family hydrolase [bacterium]